MEAFFFHLHLVHMFEHKQMTMITDRTMSTDPPTQAYEWLVIVLSYVFRFENKKRTSTIRLLILHTGYRQVAINTNKHESVHAQRA
jgi:hypothetical protein